MTDEQLERCPFCGSLACTPDDEGFTDCSNGECPGANAIATTEEWNTRPLEDELRAELTEMFDELEEERAKHQRIIDWLLADE